MTNTQLPSRACRGTPIPNPLDDIAQGLQALETHLATHLTQIHRDVHAIQIAITELGEQCRTRELARQQTFQQEQDQ